MTLQPAPAVPQGATPAGGQPPSLVLDTNIWLDLLVFRDPGVAWLDTALRARRLRAKIDAFGLGELTRVLGYPLGRFAIAPAAHAGILDACLALAREFTAVPRMTMPLLPRCRDRHDQPFLELAQACGAHCLITKDRDLLMLARRLRGLAAFVIATPAEARRLLAPHLVTDGAAEAP